MHTLARYSRFVLIVLVGQMLLASYVIFTNSRLDSFEQWRLIVQLTIVVWCLYSLNYALCYGHNPVRTYLSRLPVWQSRAWRIAATTVAMAILVVMLRSATDLLFGKPLPSIPALLHTTITYWPLALSVVMMHLMFELNEHGQRVVLQNEALKRDQSAVRFEALKQQLSPHFLFNSFATLNWLIRTDPTAAERFVQKMSQVYRYVLHQGDQRSVTLGEELAFVESYLYLLHMRFEQNLQVTIDIPADLHSWLLPPLAVQTVVENAVKHNIISQEQPLHIRISAEAGALTVRNTLQPRLDPEVPSGVGLKNLNARLHFLGRTNLVAQPQDGHFVVILPLVA